MAEFEITLHAAMRPGEQDGLDRDHMDLVRGFVTVLESKNGKTRHIPINSAALAAHRMLAARSGGRSGLLVFMVRVSACPAPQTTKTLQRAGRTSNPLKGHKHWFDPAVEAAGLVTPSVYDWR
ncbi:MAG TPA: tyrosine-type recombinase/integrase [Candidatus Sulfotelmatobacter sp.]|nr:tyrosine-type recombinase/integrase [Candidatus Sulfotelmatobacter sp.]